MILRHLFNEMVTEATTKFDFDPTTYASGNVKVEEGYEFLYGRVVGKRYVFSNTTISPNLKFEISRWSEGNEPNNYKVHMSVPEKFSKMYKPITSQLKLASRIDNTNTSSLQYSRFNLSKNELISLLKLFVSI